MSFTIGLDDGDGNLHIDDQTLDLIGKQMGQQERMELKNLLQSLMNRSRKSNEDMNRDLREESIEEQVDLCMTSPGQLKSLLERECANSIKYFGLLFLSSVAISFVLSKVSK